MRSVLLIGWFALWSLCAGCQPTDSAGQASKPLAPSPESNPKHIISSNTAPSYTTNQPKHSPSNEDQEDQIVNFGEQITDNASPEGLIETLNQIDREMYRLSRMVPSQASASRIEKLKQYARWKQQASEQLNTIPSLPSELLKQAKRGRLQALSHLSMLGEIKAAQELETYATQLAQSTDAQLAVESRLVLIGFALEKFQAGIKPNTESIINIIDELAENPNTLEMPALLAIAQVHETFKQYGLSAEARDVRRRMSKLFAEHANDELRAMYQQMVGPNRYEPMDKLQDQIEAGQNVSIAKWNQSCRDLLHSGADIDALEYLATAALRFETEALPQFADATYSMLSRAFSDSKDPTILSELKRAHNLRNARRQIIGQRLEIRDPTLNGEAFAWSDYRGRVVLLAFWAAEYPGSTHLFPILRKIRQQHPDQVAIVGFNLDANEQILREYTNQANLDWPNVRSKHPDKQGIDHPLVQQVGLASLPTVIVVDKSGRVEKISITGKDLAKTVDQLLNTASE